MTEPTTPDGDPAGPVLEAEPFLRITSTYPVDGDRVHTVELQMHLGDHDDLGEQGGADDIRSWFIDLCTCVIAQLRRPPSPAQVKVTGIAVPVVLADQVQHTADCDGGCGFPVTEPHGPDEAAGAEAGGN
jgi:hypothetical protein